LKYLNLSGNKRLEIKPDVVSHRTQVGHEDKREVLADFSGLTQLRILGLMDVTTTFVPNIPDENEDRRVRTSSSMVNKMAYGIADTLGKNEHLYMFDLVQPEFRDRPDEAIFAMFGRTRPAASNSQLSKYLHDHFVSVFIAHLNALDSSKGEGVTDALRRSFLKLNKLLHDKLYLISSSSRKMSQASTSTSTNGLLGQDMFSLRSGASGIVLYLVDKTLYVANAGDALAIVSKQGAAEPASKKHDPSDRNETARIRSAEGWVSPKGLVNDELDVSRSFGFYHLLPVVNARPYIHTYQLTELDEFVIVGNRGLWDFVSFQTAVDIARSESDPMIAAQKLRDFAISYGVEGSTMIMVIRVADLFNTRTRQPTVDSIVDYETSYPSVIVRKRRDDTGDRDLTRLNKEVPAPVGHLALVFTDIRNSTHLWEANAGMNTAMRLHNKLLRRQLRFCGGYEVKTEGDAFMCSFPTSLAALWWCLTVQVQLLRLLWPSEILECEDGKEIKDPEGRLIARGLSVRMGMHSGTPLCEPDPITHRMDYFGSMVNRSARICGSAAGGQIMISADVIREINARINQIEPWTEYSDRQPIQAVEAIRRIGITVFNMGELKLKGIEVPELLSLVYPADLAGRHKLLQTEPEPPTALGSRIQFSVEQIQALGHLCLRLEALSSSRIFRSRTERKRSVQKPPAENDQSYDAEADDNPMETIKYMSADPVMLLPALNDKVTDEEMMGMLDSLSVRIDNARSSLQQNILPEPGKMDNAISALERDGGFDELTLQRVLSILRSV
jgi:adenylate cyclase